MAAWQATLGGHQQNRATSDFALKGLLWPTFAFLNAGLTPWAWVPIHRGSSGEQATAVGCAWCCCTPLSAAAAATVRAKNQHGSTVNSFLDAVVCSIDVELNGSRMDNKLL